jgi:nucleotide-binding universal stress UspA family protein
MYRHILIATYGSELAAKAVAAGLALAKQLNAKVTAVTATDPWSAIVTGEAAVAFLEYQKAAEKDAERILGEVSATANAQGVKCDTVHVNDLAAEGIIATAKARGCDLIVMSSHGRRGLARVLLGSQATRVLTFSSVPVLICR